MTLLAIISDTHGHRENTLRAVQVLESFPVERVIHCGDIGSTAIPPLLSQWPVDYVLGNVDRDGAALRRAIAAVGEAAANAANVRRGGHRLHDRFGVLELEGRKIAFLHSDDERRFRQTVESGEWDLVCYGHTHKAEVRRQGTTWVLNPGALYRAAQHTLAIVRLPAMEIQHVNV